MQSRLETGAVGKARHLRAFVDGACVFHSHPEDRRMAASSSTRRKRPPTTVATNEAVQLPIAFRPADAALIEVNLATSLSELEEARKVALARGQAAAAVSATMAKAKMVGLLNEGTEATLMRPTSPELSLNEAARRIAFLLRLAEDEPESDSAP
jgi:hypothetical protein